MKSTNFLLFGTISMAAAAQLLIKLGAARFGNTMLDSGVFRFLARVLTTPAIFAGLTLYGVSAFLWIIVLSRVDLSYAYPMVAAGYILVSLLAWGLFHEEMTAMKGVALAVIAVGVVLLGLSQTR